MRLFGAAMVPVTTDEAYYFDWIYSLGFGFFDHPPGVAFLALTNAIGESSAFWGRFGTILCSTLTSIVFYVFLSGQSKKDILIALLIFHFSLIGLLYGFITTPDVPLFLFWVAAMTALKIALTFGGQYWLLLGILCGLGMLSKFTMATFFFVILFSIWKQNKALLKSRWPYLGLLSAILTFSPNIAWNSQNDWITYKFQLRHGFDLDRLTQDAKLPPPLPFDPNSHEAKLGSYFNEINIEDEVTADTSIFSGLTTGVQSFIDFLISQLALFGVLPFYFLRRRKFSHNDASAEELTKDETTQTIAFASALVPLVFFGTISLFGKVEANWAAMGCFGISTILAPRVNIDRKLFALLATNTTLILLVLFHAKFDIFPSSPRHDRILQETHGYEELATMISKLDDVVFADSYQSIAMIHFYQPSTTVYQWPEITRASHYSRFGPTFESLLKVGRFWLLTNKEFPPRIRGFRARSFEQLRDCRKQDIQRVQAEENLNVNLCEQLIHDWYLVLYTAN